MNNNYVDTFLDELTFHKNYSIQTISSYQRDLNQLVLFLESRNIQNSSREDILRWIKKLHSQGLSPKTLQRKLSTVRSFFNYLVKSDIVPSNPATNIKTPKDAKRLPKLLSVDELAYLLNIEPTNDIEMRDILSFDLLYSCGIRLSELSSIKISDITNSENKIRVIGKGNKERIAYFGKKTSINLNKWLNILSDNQLSGDYLFVAMTGKKLTNRAIQKRLELFSNKYASRHIHPHMLRHSFASHILDSSKDLLAVKDLLGHADIASTQIYTHLNFQQLADVFDKSHPRAKKK
jgi:integrase/recombinase XerC